MLDEREGLLAVYKPAPLCTEPTAQPGDSVVSLLSAARGSAVHAASRLDVGVSGVLLCTVGRPAARRVDALRRAGKIRRRYVALAAGALPPQGSWTWPLGRSRNRAGRVKASAEARTTQPARTDFQTVAVAPGSFPVSLAILTLHTGRLHQIRAHAAMAGAPLLGDRRYGGPSSLCLDDGRVLGITRIALHSACLRVDPLLAVVAPVPRQLSDWWAELGGSPSAWPSAPSLLAW